MRGKGAEAPLETSGYRVEAGRTRLVHRTVGRLKTLPGSPRLA